MTTPKPHVIRRGTGTPLIFVHGNGVDHRLLLDLDDVFAEVGEWERIYVDLPGFGETPALTGRGGLADVADWLDLVVDGLIGSSPFAAVGNSMGGLLARDLVARRADRCVGLALLAPVVNPVRDQRTLPEFEVLVEDQRLLASLTPFEAEAYSEMSVVQTPTNWQKFARAALPGIRAADEGAMQRISELYELPVSPDERLADFDGPVLIVAGRQDAVVGYEDQWALSRRFSRSSYAALDAAGHNVHLDQPDQVRALLRAWAGHAAPEVGDVVGFRFNV